MLNMFIISKTKSELSLSFQDIETRSKYKDILNKFSFISFEKVTKSTGRYLVKFTINTEPTQEEQEDFATKITEDIDWSLETFKKEVSEVTEEEEEDEDVKDIIDFIIDDINNISKSNTNDEMEQLISDSKYKDEEINRLANEVKRLTENNQLLSTDLNETKDKLSSMESKVEELTETNDDISKELDELKEEKRKNTIKLQQLRQLSLQAKASKENERHKRY